MIPRERTQAVLARQRPDRLPHELKLTPPLLEEFQKRTAASDPAEYFQSEVRDVFFAPPARLADFGRYYPEGVPRLWNPAGWEVGEWGVGATEGSMYHFIHIEHPMRRLTRIDELEAYPFPDLTRPERHQHLDEEVRSLKDRGLFVIGFWNGRSSKSPGTCEGWRNSSPTSRSTLPLPSICSIGSRRSAVSRRAATPRRAWICCGSVTTWGPRSRCS